MIIQAIVWLGLMLLFLAVEVGTVGLVSVWFAAGSLAAVIACLLGAGLPVQVVLFLAVSGVLLGLLRPFVRRWLTPRLTPTNVDAVVGAVGILTEAVDNVASQGRVKLGGMTWTARSTDNSPIPAGTRVRVDRIEGVKALVSPVKEEAVL